MFFWNTFSFPPVDVNVTRGSCNRFESLGIIADTREASCLLKVNLHGNVGARYFVDDGLGFGLIFRLSGEVWNAFTSGKLNRHFSKVVCFCYTFQSLFPWVIFGKMTFRNDSYSFLVNSTQNVIRWKIWRHWRYKRMFRTLGSTVILGGE